MESAFSWNYNVTAPRSCSRLQRLGQTPRSWETGLGRRILQHQASHFCEAWVASFVCSGREFLGRCGTRILRDGEGRIWLHAKPQKSQNVTWVNFRTLRPLGGPITRIVLRSCSLENCRQMCCLSSMPRGEACVPVRSSGELPLPSSKGSQVRLPRVRFLA